MTGWPVLEIELLWIVLFSTRIWPIHAKCIKIPLSLVNTNFNWMNASGNQGCIAFPFVISRMSLSYGCVLILPLCISSLRFSPHDPILTGHQALATSSAMSLLLKFRNVRVEFCFTASANAWQETHDLRNTMKHKAHTYRKVAKCFHTRVCFSNWATPPPTGKKTIRFWPLGFWTLRNLNFSQKHVQIISNHVFKIRPEAFIISRQSFFKVIP